MNSFNDEAVKSDLAALIENVNSVANRDVASVIADTESAFDQLASIIPKSRRKPGIDFEKAIWATGPTANEPSEDRIAIVNRISKDFQHFVVDSGTTPTQSVYLLSDDYFTEGVYCSLEFAFPIIKDWLNLPHGIFIVNEGFNACLLITFSRSSFFFVRAQ